MKLVKTKSLRGWSWIREEASFMDWGAFCMSVVGGCVGAFIGVLLVAVVLR